MHSRVIVFTAGLALALASAAYGQASPGPSPVQLRQGQFREVGTAFKTINDELRKTAPGRFVLASSARTIADNLHHIGALFPTGSGPAPGVKTKAKLAIWSDRAQFDRLNASAINEANRLTSVIRSNDQTAIRTQMRALGGACKSCHDQFRVAD